MPQITAFTRFNLLPALPVLQPQKIMPADVMNMPMNLPYGPKEKFWAMRVKPRIRKTAAQIPVSVLPVKISKRSDPDVFTPGAAAVPVSCSSGMFRVCWGLFSFLSCTAVLPVSWDCCSEVPVLQFSSACAAAGFSGTGAVFSSLSLSAAETLPPLRESIIFRISIIAWSDALIISAGSLSWAERNMSRESLNCLASSADSGIMPLFWLPLLLVLFIPDVRRCYYRFLQICCAVCGCNCHYWKIPDTDRSSYLFC